MPPTTPSCSTRDLPGVSQRSGSRTGARHTTNSRTCPTSPSSASRPRASSTSSRTPVPTRTRRRTWTCSSRSASCSRLSSTASSSWSRPRSPAWTVTRRTRRTWWTRSSTCSFVTSRPTPWTCTGRPHRPRRSSSGRWSTSANRRPAQPVTTGSGSRFAIWPAAMRCAPESRVLSWSAVAHHHVLAFGGSDIDLAWPADLELRVGDHLAPLGDPARQPPEREQHGEHLGREPHRPVDQPGVEVNVRIQLALDEVLIRERDLLQPERDVQQLIAMTQTLQQLVGGLLDDRRSRVIVLVDPMPKAHQLGPALLVLDLGHEVVDIPAVGLDPLEHVQHRLVRPTMQRPEQRVDPRRDRRKQVGVARPDQPHRRGRTVLLMIGMQDQQLVQRLGHDRIHVIALGRQPERHPQEVVHQRDRVVRVQERLTHTLLVRVRRDRGQLGHQPHRRDLHLLGVERVKAVLVERRERRDRRRQHRHRVRIPGKTTKEALQILMQQRVMPDPRVEVRQLHGGRQLPIDQQVRSLQERRVLSQLLDRIPAIPQNPRITIDIRDRRRTRRRVDEPRVNRDPTSLLQQLRDVVPITALGRLNQRECELLVSASKNRTCLVVVHEVVPSCRPGLVAGQTPQDHGIFTVWCTAHAETGPGHSATYPSGYVWFQDLSPPTRTGTIQEGSAVTLGSQTLRVPTGGTVPTYAYACTECEHRFEIVQSFIDDSLTECPKCDGRLRKVFNAVGVVFKGSGFYRTDSRNDARRSSSSSSRHGSKSSSSSDSASGAASSATSGSSSSDSSTASTSSGSSSSGGATTKTAAKAEGAKATSSS